MCLHFCLFPDSFHHPPEVDMVPAAGGDQRGIELGEHHGEHWETFPPEKRGKNNYNLFFSLVFYPLLTKDLTLIL